MKLQDAYVAEQGTKVGTWNFRIILRNFRGVPCYAGAGSRSTFFQIARGLTQNARIAIVAFFATVHGETYREAYYLK